MRSPTGNTEIRVDSMGSGYYQARRGGRLHAGVDYTTRPGDHVVAPISGRVVRIARPYEDQPFEGLVIRSPAMTIKMYYFKPLEDIMGQQVTEGMVIGHAQDIRTLHGPDMIPHIHLEIRNVSMNPADWISG